MSSEAVDVALHTPWNYHSFFHIHMWDWHHGPPGLPNVCLATEPVCLDQYRHLTHRSQSEIRYQFLKMIQTGHSSLTFLFSERKCGILCFPNNSRFCQLITTKIYLQLIPFVYCPSSWFQGCSWQAFWLPPTRDWVFILILSNFIPLSLSRPSHPKLSGGEAGYFCMIYILFWKLGSVFGGKKVINCAKQAIRPEWEVMQSRIDEFYINLGNTNFTPFLHKKELNEEPL